MNVVIYARFSSHSQNEQSIEGQLQVCTEFAARNGYTIVGEYIDRALSGTSDNRPQFQQMIADSSKRLFEGVLVYQLDRFARNRYDSATYKRKLKQNGVRVLSARENITDDASGILIESVLEGMAEYYSAELAQKIKRGMDINAKKCLCTGGGVALGFRVDENKRFQIDEATAPVVRKIFDMYAGGCTVAEIVTYMNERGIRTSRGALFNKNSLHTMLRNKRYIGIYTYKGTETPGGMPRIIDDDLFYQVQEIMDKNKKAPARARAKEEYLLTTKLFCGHCRDMMTGYSGTSKSGKKHCYYICNNVKRKGGCKKKVVPKQQIEDYIINICREILTPENIEVFVKGIMLCQQEDDKNDSVMTSLLKQQQSLERKKKNLLNAVMECEIESVRKTLYEQLAVLEKEAEEVDFAIKKEQIPNITRDPEFIKFWFEQLAKGGDDEAEELTYRRVLIATFINKVYLYDDRISIFFNTGSATQVEIDETFIDYVEEQDAVSECSLIDETAPPLRKNRRNAVFPLFKRVFRYFHRNIITQKCRYKQLIFTQNTPKFTRKFTRNIMNMISNKPPPCFIARR